MLFERFWKGRVPYIPQLEAAECGAAALAMVLGSMGCHVSLDVARGACGVSRDGTTAFAIVRAAESFGVRARAYRLDLEELRDLELPAILHWQLNHFVVLERVSEKSVVVVDPAVGRRVIDWTEMDRSFSGVAMTFERTDRFVQCARKSSAVSRTLEVLSSLGPSVVLLLTSALALELAALIYPAAFQIVVDHVIRPRQERWLWFVCIAYALATVIRFALSILRDRMVARMRALVDTRIVDRFVTHLSRLPLGFFQLRGAGELMSRAGGTSAIRDIAMRVITGCFDVSLVSAYCLLMLAYDLRVGALLLGFAILRVVVAVAARRAAQPHAAAELIAAGREMATSVDALAAPEAVKAFGLESLLSRRYGRRLVERLNVGADRKRVALRFQTIAWLVDGAARATLYGYGGLSVMDGRMSIGIFASFIAVEMLLDTPLRALLETVQQFSVFREHLHRIDDVLETKAEPDGALDPGPIRGAMTLENVAFRYGPASEDVVSNINI
ncbi:MAG TPA: cysteine peptidase family C39 domain-containing protein, partial [Labilithrix sp.]|nr:cysteine peptidase family C39 domain-containing protein [Labilithrix sp.]